MEEKENGCKAFLISRKKMLRSAVTLLLLVSLLFLDVVRVAAASTLEELPEPDSSTLNIEDDDYTNGSILFDHRFYYDDDYYRHVPISALPFTNGVSEIGSVEISSTRNSALNRTKKWRDMYTFYMSDDSKMFSKGSDIHVTFAGAIDEVYVYDLGENLICMDTLTFDDNSWVTLLLTSIDGTVSTRTISSSSISVLGNQLSFDFTVEDMPFDVYQVAIRLTYTPSYNYLEAAQYIGSDQYSLVHDSGVLNSKLYFSQAEYSLSDELLGKINDNLDDIWARLVAIYDMVEDGFSAIVALFYDLMDFLGSEFDDLSQTIVTQAGETRNTIVAQFTNLTNKLSTWFTNLTSTITTQFSTLTSKLEMWYQGLTLTLGNYFNTLFDQNAQEHDETINGYNDTVGSDKNEVVQGDIDNFNTSQGEILEDMNGNMDEFTLPSDGLIGYAIQFTTTFPLVASMMQSVFDSSGNFGLILSVIFAMTIFAMIVGMFKYYQD